jgi:peptidoglycan/xylan/chitin deacetylase (PgdA/CDA1 family)
VAIDVRHAGPEYPGVALPNSDHLEVAASGYADTADTLLQEGNRPTLTPTKGPPISSSTVIWRGPSGKSQVALTFDAGAGAKSTPKILAILKAYEVKSTMLLTGQWARDNPDLVRQMVADGHELANHSYSHPHLSQMASPQIEEELKRAQRQLEAISRTAVTPYFRPPFGEHAPEIREVAVSLGFQTVYWTLDSGDWLQETTAASVRDRVLNGVTDGSIVVMHLGSQATGAALEDILKGLRERKLLPVSLSQLSAP